MWHEFGNQGVMRLSLSAQRKKDALRPLVVFSDKMDALLGDTLVSLQRQIRAGYAHRPVANQQLVVRCGASSARGCARSPVANQQLVVRCGAWDVRDYCMLTGDSKIISGGSRFNTIDDSLRQLLVQGFLQREMIGYGQVWREFPLCQRRANLLKRWQLPNDREQKVVIEVKPQQWDHNDPEVLALVKEASVA